jgi:serine/threonine protein kinase
MTEDSAHLPSSDAAKPAGSYAKSGGWEPPSPEDLSKALPQYEITCMLGRGGMGAVYQGVQTSLDRQVAVKILPLDLGEGDTGFAERFKNEAKAMARLNHPGIVEVYNCGETADGMLYFVMEFVAGTDVQRMLEKQGRLPPEHALAITAHTCDALAYAHERGIVHRDIKPANIMVGYDGVVKVADFGLAKMSHAADSGLTQSGVAMGTLHYMAPEALMLGIAVDHRADLYAVGVMLYQMLTGKLPKGLFEMPSKLVAGLDPRFDDILNKALREDREIRHQSAMEFRAELDRILTQPVPKVEAGAEAAPAALPTQARPRKAPEPARRQAPPRRKTSSVTWAGLLAIAGLALWLALIPHRPSTIEGGVALDSPGSTPAAANNSEAPPPPSPKSIPTKVTAPPPSSKAVAPAPSRLVGEPLGKVRRVTELLPLADPAKDTLGGRWKRVPEGLLCEVEGRLQLPYPVSVDEFDYEFEFSLASETVGWVCARFHAAGRTIPFTMQEHRQREKPFYHFVFLDGARASTVTSSVAELPEKLVRGKRYRCTLKVRKNSLNAIWNDVPALYWEGDLRRFRHDRDKPRKDPRFPDIGVNSGSVLFHSARIIEFLPPATPPELAALQQQWDKLHAERVKEPHEAALVKLQADYLGGLQRARAEAVQMRQTSLADALAQEQQRVSARQPLPETDANGTPTDLKILREIYRTALAGLEQQRVNNQTELMKPYLSRLLTLEKELAQLDRNIDAATVKAHHDLMSATETGKSPNRANPPVMAAESSGAAATTVNAAAANQITIQGVMDVCWIKIRGNQLWIENRLGTLPSSLKVNGKNWEPEWPNKRVSAMFDAFDKPLRLQDNVTPRVSLLRGRGTVTVHEVPSPSNSSTLVLKVTDPPGGSDTYSFRVSW